MSTLISSLLLALSCSLPTLVTAADLHPFGAEYELHKGDMHIGTAKLSLKSSGNLWRWKMTTKARGIYALFTDKSPYTETTFFVAGDEIRLHEIVVASAKHKNRREFARFDWSSSKLQIERKGKQRVLTLIASVYDFLSIHLLAAKMQRQQLQKISSEFYRKGKLVQSELVFSGRQQLEINGVQRLANVYQLTMPHSNSAMALYYDIDNPLLPLRIENLDAGKTASMLQLRKVDRKL